jgi:polysaccharide biosynthesis/export protein ExoF
MRSGSKALRMRSVGAAVLTVITLGAVPAVPAFAGTVSSTDYRLDSLDKLHIRVAEWRAAENAVREWLSVTGDYTVGPSGTISIPFIGEMPVAGKTSAEVATAIGDQLQQKLGLIDRPDASVELAEFRPFFISGEVQTPGRYPYVPGLTLLKAITLAGGLRRAQDNLGQVRNFIEARGGYNSQVAQRNSLLAHRARLEAEAANKAEADFPDELRQSNEGKKLMADETAIMAARYKRLRVQLSSLADLKKLLEGEVQSLSRKLVTQNRQIDLLQQQLAAIGNLAEQGLVVKQRILTLEQQIADLQGKVIDMETASLEAKQAVSKAMQDANTLQADRETEIAQDKQQTQAELEQVELKIAMNRGLMTEAASRDPAALSDGSTTSSMSDFSVAYSIVRASDGKQTQIAADESTEVLPGDVIKVELALRAD